MNDLVRPGQNNLRLYKASIYIKLINRTGVCTSAVCRVLTTAQVVLTKECDFQML